LVTIIASGGCGDGGGDSGTETQGAGSDIIEITAVMGPIIGANVWIAPINEQDHMLASGITEDSEDLNEAGHVSLEVPEEYGETPLYIRVDGGVDIDVNDDGVRDQTPTSNDITLEFAVPTPADIEGMTIVANPLLLYASRHVIRNVRGDVPTGVDDFSNPLTIRTLMKRVAKALIQEDVDGDGTVDWQDIISFHPITDQGKSRIPWGYVIDDIERLRQEYFTILEVGYNSPYFIDPMNQEHIDIISDGDYPGGRLPEYDMISIGFGTNKNNYTIQDLVDGQGLRGGRVILPDNQKFSYIWYEPTTGFEVIEVDDYEPSLWIDPGIAYEFPHLSLGGLVGGWIFEPKEAPVGGYTIEYSTGDGQQHSETLYLHENRVETYFSIIPTIEVEEGGFINRIDLRFEDENSNVLEEPSILGGEIMIFTWGNSVEDVNSLVRGEGYYTTIEGRQSLTLYNQGISLLSPTTPHFPMNNGHKIYYEDADHIVVYFEAGDGVRRGIDMWPTYPKLYPRLGLHSIENGKVTVPFHPSTITNREVVSIRYKFDNSEWGEVSGDTLTVDIPNGATTLYVTAKDAAGFYMYDPYELDLT
jgi:hypothetical protein